MRGLGEGLIRRYVANYDAPQQPEVRANYGKLTALVGIVSNVLLFLSKLITGILVGSVAIRGDAINNLSDTLNSIISLVSFRMSRKPADAEHPYGHARVEYFASTIVAVVILYIALQQFLDSVERIRAPQDNPLSPIAIAVLLASILVKLWLYHFNLDIGRRLSSQLIRANAVDSLADVLATSAVLISAVLSPLIDADLDGYMGIAVALFIAWSGIGILRDTADSTVGTPPSAELVERIESYVLAHDGILGVHDLVVHSYGPGRTFATLDVEVDAQNELLAVHELIDNIERNFVLDHNIQLVLHVDPVRRDDPEQTRLYELTKARVARIDERLHVHDFRLVQGPERLNLIFDVACPEDEDFVLEDREVRKRIIDDLRSIDPSWNIVVTVESHYLAKPSTKLR